MRNKIKAFGIIIVLTVIGFIFAACPYSPETEEKDPEVTDPNPWIDPATQTTQLTGGEILSSYTGVNMDLQGSPYGYETWDYSGGTESSNTFTWYGPNQGGGGAYKAEWTGYFLARLGFFWGNGGAYTQYQNIYVDYNYQRTANSTSPNGGFIGVYGWSRNPSAGKDIEKLIEYYIVDDWFWDGQLETQNIYQTYGNTTYGKELGSFQADGAIYKIYSSERHNEPSIDGTKTFTQIFSVRQGRRTCGTISVTEHFKEWSKHLALGNLYEAKFKVEAFGGGSGNLDLTYLYMAMEKNARPAVPAPPGVIVTGKWSGLSIPTQTIARQHPVFEGKSNVLQVTPGNNWSVLEYGLNSYSGQVNISVSMDVWLNNAAKAVWQINNAGYPEILGSTETNLTAGTWHTLSVVKMPVTLEAGRTFYLSKDQLGNNDIFIANFTISVSSSDGSGGTKVVQITQPNQYDAIRLMQANFNFADGFSIYIKGKNTGNDAAQIIMNMDSGDWKLLDGFGNNTTAAGASFEATLSIDAAEAAEIASTAGSYNFAGMSFRGNIDGKGSVFVIEQFLIKNAEDSTVFDLVQVLNGLTLGTTNFSSIFSHSGFQNSGMSVSVVSLQ